MILSFSWNVRILLEKLGMSEWKAFTYENKIAKYEDWVLRHPITIMSIRLPETPNNKWVQVSASLDNTHVRLVSKTGIWRKTYIWESMAKITKESKEDVS